MNRVISFLLHTVIDKKNRTVPVDIIQHLAQRSSLVLQCHMFTAAADRHIRLLEAGVCTSPGQNLVMAEAMFSKADRASEEGKAWMASRALLLW